MTRHDAKHVPAQADSPASLLLAAAATPRARYFRRRIPMERFGTVDEVADIAVLLATNGYMTGQTVNVNGGWYMT